MWSNNWNNNWSKDIDKNDKVYNYWKNSVNKQFKNNYLKNTIKVSDSTDHNNKFTIEETSIIDGKTFIKEYKFNNNELKQYLISKPNYTLINKDKMQDPNQTLNKYSHVMTNNIPESIHRLAYQRSFNTKSYNS